MVAMSDPMDEDHMHAAKLFKQGSGDIADDYKQWEESIRENTGFDDTTRELLALAAAASTQCSYCVHTHGQKAIKHGATREQVAETIQIASQVRAGATMSYGLEALEHLEE